MVYLEQLVKCHIDYESFVKLLKRVSRVVNLAVDIKGLNGESLLSVCNRPHGSDCGKQGLDPDRCSALSARLFRRTKNSGQAEVHKCLGNVDIMGIPLGSVINHGSEGMLFACSGAGTGVISSDSKELLKELAERISMEIQNRAELEYFSKELSEKYEELNLIYDIGNKLSGITDTQQNIEYIADQAAETLQADILAISVPQEHIWHIMYGDGNSGNGDILDASFLHSLSESVLHRLTSPDSPNAHIVVNDVRQNAHLRHLTDVPLGLLAVPIKLKNEIAGFLCAINFYRSKLFQTNDVSLATSLSQQLSSTLTNAKLYQEMKYILLGVITTLIHSIEAKDTYTKGHSERVNTLTMLIADKMNLAVKDREALHWASTLHDIGKIGVPEELLTKKGRLNENEYNEIKKHSERGFRILLPIEPLKNCLAGIRHHHERFDGAGYPSGLKGDEIPLYARIIAVADTYDAMTSTRPYRERLSYEDAIAELNRVKGTQLDSTIVDIFLEAIERSEHK